MSDKNLDRFLHYGTAAERAAFTPSPATGTQPLYKWYETDTDTEWSYTTSWKQTSGSAVGGGLSLLEKHTASSSAALDFTTAITSAYDEYVFELVGLVPATNSVDLWMRVSTDGGSTYDTANNYAYSGRYTGTEGATGDSESSNGGAKIRLSSSQSNASTATCAGSIRLYTPSSTALHKAVSMDVVYVHSNGNRYRFTNVGMYLSTTAVNAVRFLYSSGNITSGTVRAYGVAK